jgi:hypothetical protein|tara:strand:+ start:1039 stop:2436 length:1398 start_codon:yes stop_codon:yes gene_type:complete
MAYEGVGIPKIYDAQMPRQSSGGDIISRLLPSLASAYISGMRQEEASQLSADTKMYATVASSAANYKTADEVKGVLDRLISERAIVAKAGDNVRASYLDASIAAVQPYYNTQLKQGQAKTLIDEGIEKFEALENTPGYKESALNLYKEWDSNLQEYDPYFTPRMLKDLKGQYDEMNLRLSALSVLDILDSDGFDAEGKPIKLDGIQINEDAFPNQKSLFHAKAANEYITRGLATPEASSQLITKGLSQFSQMQTDLGVANAVELKAKNDTQKRIKSNIYGSAKTVEGKFNHPSKELFKDIYPSSLKDMELTQNFDAIFRAGEVLDKPRIKQLRNVAVHDLSRILKNTSDIDGDLKNLLVEWGKGGYSKNAPILDSIYDMVSYWNPRTAKHSRNDYLNELDYPGIGSKTGKDKNVQDLVITYLEFLENLELQEGILAGNWGASYSQASVDQTNNNLGYNLSNLLNR